MSVAANVLGFFFNIFIISILVYLYVNNYISGYTILGILLFIFFIELIVAILLFSILTKNLKTPKNINGEKFKDNDKKNKK